MLTFKTRTMPRAAWRALYRYWRIMRRESEKAALDALLYGFGHVRIDNDGTIRHVPYGEVIRHA